MSTLELDPVDGESEDPSVGAIVAAVEARVPAHPRHEIERVVEQELRRLRGARVTMYAPLLAERAAVARLGRLRLLEGSHEPR